MKIESTPLGCRRPLRPRSPRPRVLDTLCVCTCAPAGMSCDATPIGLPYFTTASPAANRRGAPSCARAESASRTDDGRGAGQHLASGLERLERGRHVVALADHDGQPSLVDPARQHTRRPPRSAGRSRSLPRRTPGTPPRRRAPRRGRSAASGVRDQELLPARPFEELGVHVGAEHARRDGVDRIPCGAHSTARPRVSPATPDLLAP